MDAVVDLREIANEIEKEREILVRLVESAKTVCRIMPTQNSQKLKDSALAELRSILAEVGVEFAED